MSNKICVARIGAAHGVRGEVKLWSFTEDPAAVADYGPLETEDGARKFEIEALRPAKDHFIARLAGIGDRNAAEALRNLDLYVPRERLPVIEEPDTFYHSDLIGLDAVTADGSQVGTVHAVHNFGAGDIIEITPLGSGDPTMLPFNETTVPKVDLAAKQIVIAPPAAASVPPAKGEGRPPKRHEDAFDSPSPPLRPKSAPKASGGE
ncbi:MAG TPA: ribosome maturation factor RimM [Pseudolabrys sp.]|jgi:16S rRNA processing protein RimM|nr:ribosome maturation factor RimM [Pseudolabrys sp.]